MSRARSERGSITPLLIGLFAVVLTLVVVGVDVTALHLARVRLLDAADAAAADAADAISDDPYYRQGAGQGPVLTDESVHQVSQRHLDRRSRPGGVQSWWLAGGTGTPDGRTAVVRLQARVDVPILTPVVEAAGGSVTVTVESRAISRTR